MPFTALQLEVGQRLVHGPVEPVGELVDALDDTLGGDVELGQLADPDLEHAVDMVRLGGWAEAGHAFDSVSQIS